MYDAAGIAPEDRERVDRTELRELLAAQARAREELASETEAEKRRITTLCGFFGG